MRQTKKHKEIIDLLNHGGDLKKDNKGYYYIVPTTCRRSGKMRVSNKMFNMLKDKGFINDKTLNHE